MSALNELGLAEARDGLKAKDFSAKEIAEACLGAMEHARDLNVFVMETADTALAMAAEADKRIDAGDARPLEGVPVGVKDLYCTKGVQTTAGSGILRGFKPEYESSVTQQLWDAGAVMLGKLNMDEFAMGSSNETSVFGPAVNPWKAADDDAERSPGGSSGGSSAAVAARLCPGATASDTGGSIRQPAAFTGTVGVKPTYGRASRWGMVAFASSLDQAGPITRSVRDAALMLTHMCAPDEKDSTSLDVETPDWEALLDGGVKGMRIGIPKEYRMDGTPEPILKLWDQGVAWLKAAGAEVAEISLPHTEYGLPAYYVIAPAEASSNLARYDGVRYGERVEGKDLIEMYENTRGKGFGNEVQRRILIGAYALSAGYYDAYYLKALKVRRRVADDFKQAFETVDLILTPTTPNAAFPIGRPLNDPIQMYLNDVFTVGANLAGLPAISVPAGLDAQGLPLGLHLIAKPLDEATMFKGALALEEAAGFDAKPQAWWEN